MFCNRCKQTGHYVTSCPEMPTFVFGVTRPPPIKTVSEKKFDLSEVKAIELMVFDVARCALGLPLMHTPGGLPYFCYRRNGAMLYVFVGSTWVYAASKEDEFREVVAANNGNCGFIEAMKFSCFKPIGRALADELFVLIPMGDGTCCKAALQLTAPEIDEAMIKLSDKVGQGLF